MDNSEEALMLLSGYKFVRVKRKTSYFSLDFDFWLNLEDEDSQNKIYDLVDAQLKKSDYYDIINLSSVVIGREKLSFSISVSDYKVYGDYKERKFEGILYGEVIRILF